MSATLYEPLVQPPPLSDSSKSFLDMEENRSRVHGSAWSTARLKLASYFAGLSRVQIIIFSLVLVTLIALNLFNLQSNITKLHDARANPVSSASSRPYRFGEINIQWLICDYYSEEVRAICNGVNQADWRPCPQPPEATGLELTGCILLDPVLILHTPGYRDSFAFIQLASFNTFPGLSRTLLYEIIPWPRLDVLPGLDVWTGKERYGTSVWIPGSFGQGVNGSFETVVSALVSQTIQVFDRSETNAQVDITADLVVSGTGFFNIADLPWLPHIANSTQMAGMTFMKRQTQQDITTFTYHFTFTVGDVLTSVFSVLSISLTVFFFLFPLDTGHAVKFRFRLAALMAMPIEKQNASHLDEGRLLALQSPPVL